MRHKQTLEILISTMNRKDLSFLKPMFPNHDLADLKILIVNQTKSSNWLESDYENIRVINSNEFGLSKSRNLALQNASADIVLFADDDVVYLENFENIILAAYQKYTSAALISFQFLNDSGQLKKEYPAEEGFITSTKRPLSSVEISVNLNSFRKQKIYFNENFGLGTEFPATEEQIFRRQILKKGMKVAFVSKPILIHSDETSASNQGSESFIKAMSAQKFLAYGNFAYLWLLKFVFFLFRHKFITAKDILKSYQIGSKAIQNIKKSEA